MRLAEGDLLELSSVARSGRPVRGFVARRAAATVSARAIPRTG